MAHSPPAIVADSTIALGQTIIGDLPIFIAPFEVHHEGRVYADGLDMTPSEFYALQREAKVPPRTSAPQPSAFLDAFRRAAQRSDHLVCLTLSAELSAAHRSALLAQEEAATELPGIDVHVADPRIAGPAEGLIALEAARLAATGATTEQVLEAVQRRLESVHLIAYLETLYYVWKGGRVPRVAMWLGRLLDVKPIMHFSGGRIRMLERPRTTRRAIERLVTLVEQRLEGRPARVAVVHAASPDRAQELAERLQDRLRPVELFQTEFTPVIGAHTGPGLVGCAFHPVEPESAA